MFSVHRPACACSRSLFGGGGSTASVKNYSENNKQNKLNTCAKNNMTPVKAKAAIFAWVLF